MLFIEEIVGAGEIAIADHRSVDPSAPELARLVLDTHGGGMLSRKAGVTHFHTGGHDQRLKRLRELLDGDYPVTPDMLYPTHIERTPALMDEAIALVAREHDRRTSRRHIHLDGTNDEPKDQPPEERTA